MTIKCSVCRYDNPLGRVHCLQCGTKLDLSKVVPEGTKVKGGGAIYLGKSDKPRRPILKTIGKLFDLAVFLLLVAVIVVMLQEPPVKDVATSAMHALVAKGKLDGVGTAVKLGSRLPVPVEFTEQEINAYLNDVASPHHLTYPPPSSGGFGVRIARYQIEFLENEVGLVAIGEIRAGNFTKRIIIRATGRFVGSAGQRRLEFTTASMGRLPLHKLPGGNRLAGFVGDQFFRFAGYDEEWKLIQAVGDLRVAPGKIVVSAGSK